MGAIPGSRNDFGLRREEEEGNQRPGHVQAPVLSAENDNAFLGDVFSSDQINAEKPMSAGFYRLEKGKPLVYTYTYDEMKIIVEGDFTISDSTGQEVKAKPGDVFFFPDGATITFTTENYGLAFFCGQRKKM
ncbi:hypothetical protein PG997_007313 [Apiospora hydei]|uniref:Ethanolamine utilization protein n=1 Tax=Apiospora hydei TaxID=1337664 RepID=A0ABR1W7N5_9PEZI